MFSTSETSCSPLRLLVLPWSVAIPNVVYLFTCSIDLYPSLRASSISETVTSFWKSKNLLKFFLSGSGTHQNLSWFVNFFSETWGTETLLSLLVIFFDNWYPFSKDVLIVSSRLNIPLADPTVVSFCFDLPGTKASIFSSNFVLFPDWDDKWIVGVQKPDTQIQSQFIFSIFPKFLLSDEIWAISADLTFL